MVQQNKIEFVAVLAVEIAVAVDMAATVDMIVVDTAVAVDTVVDTVAEHFLQHQQALVQLQTEQQLCWKTNWWFEHCHYDMWIGQMKLTAPSQLMTVSEKVEDLLRLLEQRV